MKSSVFQTVLLSAFGAFGVAGVLVFAFLVGGGGNTGIGRIIVWGPFDETAFNAVLRHLSDTEDRYKSITYVQKQPEVYERELVTALAEGTGPDLFVITADRAVVDAGKVLQVPYDNFPATQFDSTFVEAASPFLAESGVIAVPFLVDPLILYWNRDMLAGAGYASPPSYWDETYEMAEKMTKRTQSNTVTKSAVALGEYVNVDHAKDIIATLIMQAGGSIVNKDSAGKLQAALVSRPGQPQLSAESAVRFFTEFSNPSKADYSWNRSLPSSRRAFSAGDLALYLGPASEVPVLRNMNPNLNFAPAPMPQVRDASRVLTYGAVYGLALPRVSTNPQGALTAAFLLAGPEASSAFSTALGIPSARRDVLGANIKATNDLASRSALVAKAWLDPDPGETDTIFRDMIESVASGAAHIPEAVQRADQAISQLINI